MSGTAAVDVVVVGAGIVGAASAAFLAEAGASVELVESTAVAAGASGRNSGVVQHPLDPVLARLHVETVALLRELEAADPAAFALPAGPAGLLYLALDGDAARDLAAGLATTHPELAPTYLDPDTLRRLEPALGPDVAACRLSIGLPVGPGDATRAYAAAAMRAGAIVRIGQPARLERSGDRVTGVRIGGELRTAGTVVVAAGPWTPALVDPAGRWTPIKRLWGAVAEVELADPPGHVLEELEIDATIEPDAAGQEHARDAAVSFSLVTAAGRSVLGSTFQPDESDDAALVPELVARGSRFVPAIGAARVIASRRCARPLSLDGRPLIGRLPGCDGVVVAAGHGPWGISTGAASARLAADLVLGRVATPPAELDAGRFGVLGQPSRTW